MKNKLIREFIKSQLHQVYEGKAAAVKLLSQFEDPNLTYAPFTEEVINKFLPKTYDKFPGSEDTTILGRILYSLVSAGLVNPDRPPKFQFGSTRLAAYMKYGMKQLLSPEETPEIAGTAAEKKLKTGYGDLDVDLQFSPDATTKKIADFLVRKFPFIKALVKNEVHLAIQYGEHVYQVDLIDVKKEKEQAELVFQFSAFKDLASEVKGVFQTELLKAVAAMKDPVIGLKEINDFSITEPSHEFSIQYKKFIDCGFAPTNLRYQISKLGVRLVVDFKKPTVKTMKSLECPLQNILSYDNLDQVAKFLLDDDLVNSSIIMSAVELARYVGNNFPVSKKQIIATIMQDNRSIKRISVEDQEKGLKAILKLLKSESNISEQHWMQYTLPRKLTSFFKHKKLVYKKQKLDDNELLSGILRKLQTKKELSNEEKSTVNSALDEIGGGDPTFAIREKIFRNQQAARGISDTDFDFLSNRSSTYLNSRDFSYSMPGKIRRKLPHTE